MGKVGDKLPLKLGKEKRHPLGCREALAGLAMNGILARGTNRTSEEISEVSVRHADALIRELKK